MNIPYVFKKCSKCEEILPATTEYFYKEKRGKYGLRGDCKKCEAERGKQYRESNKEAIAKQKNEYMRRYYQENKEDIKEYQRQYYQENKEAINEQHRQYYEANKEADKERCKHWREVNKEYRAGYQRQYYQDNKEAIAKRIRRYKETPQGQVVAFNSRCRRRAKEQTQGRGITKEQWLECMSFFNWQCAYSGEYIGGEGKETRSLDHIEPINKGGANEIWNVVPMYRAYNISKHDKDMLQWYKEQTFFSEERLNKIYEWQEYAYKKWHDKEEII